MFRVKIEKLQQLQKNRLNGRPLSQLPQEAQIAFCRTNKEIRELADRGYEKTKSNPETAFEVAHYFVLFVDYGKSIKLVDTTTSASATTNFSDIEPRETNEDTFKLGICYMNGIGNYIQNTQIAFQLFEHAAKQGYAPAQFYLGYMYNNGHGILRNQVEAVKWYRLAAEQGYARGQCSLGYMYMNGDSILKNQVEAVKWYRLAAEQGYSSAQNNLGFSYDAGKGVLKNQVAAVKWYRLAAEQGNKLAQNNLGTSYRDGDGVLKNQVEAVKYFRLAAEQGHQKAIETLSKRDNFSAMYHADMLDGNVDAVVKLLSEKSFDSVSEELLFDIQRAARKDVLFEMVLTIVSKLKEKGFNTDIYQSEINKVYIQRILASHEEKLDDEEAYDDKALTALYDTLAKINFAEVAREQIQPLLNLVIDSWYAAANIPNPDIQKQITAKAALYSSQLISKLNSQTEPVIDSHTAKQCLVIQVKHRFGAQYEVALASLDLSDLNLCLALLNANKSVQQMNQILERNMIIEVNCSIDLIRRIVTELAAYLKRHSEKVSISPYLADLNACLKDLNLNDERDLKDILAKMLTHASDYQSAKKQISGSTLFAIKDDEVKMIYKLLKRNDLKGLAEFLQMHTRMDADHRPASPAI